MHRTRRATVNLHPLLEQREREGRPIRVGLIGAGRFGTMYLAQSSNIPGVHVVGIADINVERAKGALKLVDWLAGATPTDAPDALAPRTTAVTPHAGPLFDAAIGVIGEATGNPIV